MIDTLENKNLGTVLFVDDEDLILQMVENVFETAPFKVLTVSDAPNAMEVLKANPASIIISDYKMPKMNGLELLSRVKDEFPTTRRVIGTGYIEELEALHAIDDGLVSDIYPKPWDFNVLEQEITSNLRMLHLLQNQQLLKTINSIDKLPTLPKMYQRFRTAIERRESADHIADLLSEDPSVSAQVIRLANSAFYGHGTVNSIQRAIVKLGFDNVSNVLLTVLVTKELDWTEDQKSLLRNIFVNSVLINIICIELHKAIYESPPDEKDTSLGLLYRIGLIVLLQYFPEHYQSVIELQKKRPELSFYDCEIELDYEGRTFAEIGTYLLGWWNFPDRILDIVLFHHSPELLQESDREIAELLLYSERFVTSVLAGIKRFPPCDFKFLPNRIPEETMKEAKSHILQKVKNLQAIYGS